MIKLYLIAKQGYAVMHTVQEITQAITRLPEEELARFREWFEGFDARAWDKLIESDIESGKLDSLANQAIADFRAGKCEG
jgi:hypothetical protein